MNALHLMQPYQEPVALVLLLASLLAGRGPERWAAATLAISPVLVLVSLWVPGAQVLLGRMVVAHFAADSVTFLALALIAVEANRLYTLMLAALQLLVLLAHLARLVDPQLSPTADALLVCGLAWLELAVLATGLVLHALRERRWGRYRAWRRSGDRPFIPPPAPRE